MPSPQTLTETWVSGGVEQSVVTERDAVESEANWRLRHANAVAAAQILFPPDP